MRRFITVIWIVLSHSLCLVADNYYGFRLQGRPDIGEVATALRLNDGVPFPLNKDLIVGLKLEVRNEPVGGQLLCMHTGGERVVEVRLEQSSDDNAASLLQLVVGGVVHEFPYRVDRQKVAHTLNVKLDREKSLVTFVFDQNSMTVETDLSRYSEMSVLLGTAEGDDWAEVAPVNVSDVHILLDSVSRYFWELKYHKGEVSYDAIQKAPAVGVNPRWMMDEHHSWTCIYTCQSEENVQVAFNPCANLFYIVTDRTITLFSPETKQRQELAVEEGFRASIYSNTLVYDTVGQRLVSYSLDDRQVSFFDFATRRWSRKTENRKETSFFNHAWVQHDSVGYAFGGYGYHTFFSSLFRVDLHAGEVTECTYAPEIRQRTCAAAAVVGNELYIYGGRGQTVDNSEKPNSHFYYDLYAIDLETMKSRLVWEKSEKPRYDFIPASTMYYVPQDTAFYVAGEQQLLKVSKNRPEWTELTTFMPAPKGPYKDMVYDLYYAPNWQRMYLLANRRIDDGQYDVAIYSVRLPLTGLPEEENEESVPVEGHVWRWMVAAVLLLSVTFLINRMYRRKRGRKQSEEKNEVVPTVADSTGASSLSTVEETPLATGSTSIYLMGKFKVTDREGNDVTASYTARMRSLLLIFLMHHETKQSSVQIEKVDECIWADKDVEAARNNRNVYMRKLRIELKKTGNLEIVNHKGFFQIHLGEEVYVDYFELLRNITLIEQNGATEVDLIKRTLKIMQQGTLLPEVCEEWLDAFKAELTGRVVNLLEALLNRSALETELLIQIADTIFIYDSLSEVALAAKCRLLSRIGKRGLAKGVYERFCKEYKHLLGVDYPVAFADISD